MPVYFVWLKYISWLNYSNELIIMNQWEGIDKIDCPEGSTICFNTGDNIISYLGIKKVSKFFLFFLLEKNLNLDNSQGQLCIGLHIIGCPYIGI